MQIRYGYAIEIVCDRPTALVTMLDVHPSRRHDRLVSDEMQATALLAPDAAIALDDAWRSAPTAEAQLEAPRSVATHRESYRSGKLRMAHSR